MNNNFSHIKIRTQNNDFINYSHLIIDNESKYSAIIDPSWELDKILKVLKENNTTLKLILLTHSHNDHTNLVNELVKLYDVNVYISKDEAKFYDFNCKNLNLLNDNDALTLGKTNIKSLLTPGHTYGSMCFVVEEQLIFTGDTVFIEGCGRCDLQGGSPYKMYESLNKIKATIDSNIIVYPGHLYQLQDGITLEELYKNNVYFNIDSLDSFVNFRMRKNKLSTLKFT